MEKTYDECKDYFQRCKAFWMSLGDREGIATSKAFWWDFVEVMNSDNSWDKAKEKFAMDFRGYKVGDPVPSPDFVERGAV